MKDWLIIMLASAITWLGYYHLYLRKPKKPMEADKWLDIIANRLELASTIDDLLDLRNLINQEYEKYCNTPDRISRVLNFKIKIDRELDRICK